MPGAEPHVKKEKSMPSADNWMGGPGPPMASSSATLMHDHSNHSCEYWWQALTTEVYAGSITPRHATDIGQVKSPASIPSSKLELRQQLATRWSHVNKGEREFGDMTMSKDMVP